MALIQIDDVVPLADGSDHIAGASVEVPTEQTATDLWWLQISGWVVGHEAPVSSVEVVHQHAAVRSVPVDIERLDVAWAHPDLPGAERSGFRVRVGGAWLPDSFVLRLEAGFENGHRVPFALIRGHRSRLALALAQAGVIQPISVTGLGRSGSTLVMGMLRRHPEVIVHGGHPFATRPAAYWTHMFRVLAEPADSIASASAESFDSRLGWVGAHPMNDAPATDSPELATWLGTDYVQGLADFCRRSTSGFYSSAAAAAGITEPRFFAEKLEPGDMARTHASLYPAGREILLVRDFRDMACSMLAFHDKSGRISYGRDLVSTDEDFVVALAPSVARLASYVRERETAGLVVRYEDLVTRPGETLAGILTHAGLSSDAALRREMVSSATDDTAELAAHRTTSTGEESVGRFRNDMSDELLEAAEDAFGPALAMFDYPLGRGKSKAAGARKAAARRRAAQSIALT